MVGMNGLSGMMLEEWNGSGVDRAECCRVE